MASAPAPRGYTFTLLSRDPAWIAAADSAGVARIGIDIERLGKHERQRHIPDARISDHELSDLSQVVASIRHARPFIRLNPLHAETQREIDTAIALGARAIMLPQFQCAAEAHRFVDWIDGRAEALLLLETAGAFLELKAVVSIPGVSELMVGLNDLSQSMGLCHPMQMAASPVLDDISRITREAGLAFGFGGVAAPGIEGLAHLPVPADLLLARYACLGARSAWLARSFVNHLTPATLPDALDQLCERLNHWFACDQAELLAATQALRAHTAPLSPATPIPSLK
ncbi:aldolase/citrate lyase family protein [Verrucomicrobium spinosum]|uniref:aldolase/citrate lyase family protein n=1 Tax=Verrucomicrobium spinosum TaxID=2736 RepID=UPI000174630A|nr:aldolase/citrate lyase family protein [Verrucomicrobium spinosum]